MIRYTIAGLALPVAVAETLTTFAGRDATRPSVAVGIDDGYMCATDGHTAVRFLECDPNGQQPMEWNGSVWSRDYVLQQAKVGKATKAPCLLAWNARIAGATFPPLAQVVPARGIVPGWNHWAVDPDYLARIAKVAKACDSKTTVLIAASDDLSPTLWVCEGNPDGNQLTAEVILMPICVEIREAYRPARLAVA